MSAPDPEALPGRRRLRVVVDSNVFPRRRWLRPLIQAARDGYVQLIRSPLIIAEAHRLLTWLWLERHDGDLSAASWRRCSENAKVMFAHLTAAFHVVEDRPPAAELWTATPPDEWDVPIWTAALRAQADVIVSENLEDGPPADDQGMRSFGEIDFLHPADFLEALDYYVDAVEAPELPPVADAGEGRAETNGRGTDARLHPDLWREIARRWARGSEDEE